jgi:hypothetical protein
MIRDVWILEKRGAMVVPPRTAWIPRVNKKLDLHWISPESPHLFFTKLVLDWEVEVVTSFFELLYSHIIRQGGEDRICWIPSKRKKFEEKS